MKTNCKVISAIIAVTKWKWTRPALVTLALALVGATGCDRSNDSGHDGNHGNHGNDSGQHGMHGN